MTQQEYEQKRRECWDDYKRHNLDGEVQWQPVSRYDVFCDAFDRAYALGKLQASCGQVKEAISQEDVEKASVEYADKTAKQYEVCNSEFVQEIMVAFEQGVNFALGKQEKDADTMLSGWVCRDNNSLNAQVLIGDKPKRTGFNYWENKSADCITLPKDLFPDLTWSDEPQEVEIIIKRKKK